MADPVTGLLVVAGASTAGKAYFQTEAEEAKLSALNLEREEKMVQYQQRTLANFSKVQKMIDSQVAQATVRGVSLGSSSLTAIERNTFDIASKEQQNLETEHDIFEHNVKAEKANVRNTLFGELFGDVSDFAGSALSVNRSLPKIGKVT